MTTTRKTVIERTYQAELQDVWTLWTTKEGLESWWAPEGFTTKVGTLELRPGGLWEYMMTATAPEQIDFLKKEGIPLSTTTRATYTEVLPQRRLAYDNLIDFVPGVASYAASVVVDFAASVQGVRVRIVMDAMHSERWTELARLGFESQLGRLTHALAARLKSSSSEVGPLRLTGKLAAKPST